MKLSFLSMALPLAGLFSGVFSSPVSPLDSLDVTKTDTAQYTKTTEIAQATSTESKNIGTWVVDLSSQSNKTVANIRKICRDPRFQSFSLLDRTDTCFDS